MANVTSHMNVLTFLVEMTLDDLMKLNQLIQQDGDAFIMLNKGTETGLYDPCNGGGSCFEIELEKDVQLPVKYIRSALPDGGDGYGVNEVYGLCASAWRHGGVGLIHKMEDKVAQSA